MIAIHDNGGDFVLRWCSCLSEHNIEYELLNFADCDVKNFPEKYTHVLCHFHHASYQERLFMSGLLQSLELLTIKVFPDHNTRWSFDDKLIQSYLFESNNLNAIETYRFYTLRDALKWIKVNKEAVVFKLRGGAGSSGVFKLENRFSQSYYAILMFTIGLRRDAPYNTFKDRILRFYRRPASRSLIDVVIGFYRFIIPTRYARLAGRDKGYLIFQKFIPDAKGDVRIIVIGSRAFALKRMVRKGDFRASGSGIIDYDINDIDVSLVESAFKLNEKLLSQCLVIDYIKHGAEYHIVEISYGFSSVAYDNCIGYWESDLTFIEGEFNPYQWMLYNMGIIDEK